METSLSQSDYQFLRHVMLQQSGLVLGDEQQYLVVSRLAPLAQQRKLGSISELIASMQDGQSSRTNRQAIAEALATHESLFFREKAAFAYLTAQITQQLESLKPPAKLPRLRLWSAACATGQEPYSLLMAMDALRTQRYPGLEVEIFATDFSQQAVDKAQLGVFSEFEVSRGLTANQVQTYLQKHPNGYQVQEAYRQRVRFARHNLLEKSLHWGQFDFIFCCNVLIYFDLQARSAILSRLVDNLYEHGNLLLGTSENANNLCNALQASEAGKGWLLSKAPH